MIRIKECTTGREVYFRNKGDLNAYLHVFKDHWCNLQWETPVEVKESNVPYKYKRYVDDDPKERAEADLSWGFCLIKNKEMRDDNSWALTPDQRDTIETLVEKFGGGNND